jgi:hypothetical protein
LLLAQVALLVLSEGWVVLRPHPYPLITLLLLAVAEVVDLVVAAVLVDFVLPLLLLVVVEV